MEKTIFMIPQIIIIIWDFIILLLGAHLHGKEKTGKHNFFTILIVLAVQILILYLGGFYDPLIK